MFVDYIGVVVPGAFGTCLLDAIAEMNEGIEYASNYSSVHFIYGTDPE